VENQVRVGSDESGAVISPDKPATIAQQMQCQNKAPSVS